MATVSYQCLPADVAFKMMFRDGQGHLWDLFDDQVPTSLLKAYAGTSGSASGFFLNGDLEEFPLMKGRHQGHLVLVACPERAYSDPRLINIWGGTLELPMTLMIEDGT